MNYHIVISGLVAAGLFGCSSGPKGPGYRKLPDYRIATVTDKDGSTSLTVTSQESLAFEEVIE